MAGKFEPKTPVNLDPPKLDVKIAREELEKATGMYRLFSTLMVSFEYSCRSMPCCSILCRVTLGAALSAYTLDVLSQLAISP